MKNTKFLLLTCLMALVGWNATAQRVIAYHQGTKNDLIQSWYWDYITDINYSFLQISSTGNVGLGAGGAAGSDFEKGIFTTFLNLANAQGKRITISVGGADKVQASAFKTMSATKTKARILATNVVQFAKTNGLSGIDIDWEPEGTTGKPTSAEWINLLSAFREVINENGGTLELSAALFPYKWNNDFVTTASHQYVDHFNLMVYDFGGDYPHHSNTIPNGDDLYPGKTVEEACISYWNKTKGLDKTKMVLGLPFYGRSSNWAYSQNDYKLYRDIVGTSTSKAQLDASGGFNYNGQPTIKRKTKYAITNGLKGVMMWELVGDATTKAVSLLAAINEEKEANGCPSPNLGDDQNMCGKETIELDASLGEADYTFEWYKNNIKQLGSGRTYTAKSPGTYKVVSKSKAGSCSQENVIILTEDYPELEVLDVPLCGAGDELTVDATIVDFDFMTYKWTGPKTSNTAEIAISTEGDYTITVSDPYGHCATKSKTITASTSGVSVKGDTACASGDEVKLKVLDAGSFSWWDAETGGTQLGTEDSLYQTITATTSFYVQKTGGAVQYDLGLKYDHAEATETWNGPGNGDYEFSNDGTDDVRLYFTAHQALTLDEAVVHMNLGDGSDFNGTFNVCLYDSDNTEVECKEVFLEANGKGTIPLGFTVEPGNYYLGIPDAKQWILKNPWKSAEDGGTELLDYASFGVTDVIAFNSSVAKSENDYGWAINSWYPGFYDMKISTGKPCPRVPVYAILDETNVKCVKYEPVVTITAPTTDTKVVNPASVELVANATDGDGVVVLLKFYVQNDKDEVVKELTGSALVNDDFSADLSGLDAGTYTIVAIATDNDGQSTTSDAITISISDANEDPTITLLEPSDNTTISANSAQQLSVLASDPDGDDDLEKVIYTIKDSDDKIVTEITNTVVAGLFLDTYTFTSAGIYKITATVYDKSGATASTTITITIAGNKDPIVTITAPNDGTSFNLNSTIDLSATATDEDGTVQSVSYLVKFQGQDVETVTGTGTTYTGSFIADKAGEYTIIATATDNQGATSTNFVTITINDVPNDDPIVTVVEPANTSIKLPNNVNFDITATDPDGTIASVTIEVNGENLTVSNSATSYTTTWDASIAGEGTYTATIVATDNKGAKTTKTVNITILAIDANLPPTIVIVKPTNNPLQILVGETVDLEATITDDNSIASVKINNIPVTGVGSTYSFSGFTATETGTFDLVIVATDDEGAITTKTLTIIVDEAPNVVITSPTANQSIEVTTGNNTINVVATVTDNNELATVVIKVGETSISTTNSGSTYTGIYTATTGGTVTATVIATDNNGLVTTEEVTFTIVDKINTDSEISEITVDPNTVRENDAVNISVNSTDVEGVDKVEITVTDANNQTTVMNSNTSGNTTTSTWNTTTAGNYTITVTVTDNKGNTTTQTKVVTVLEPNKAPDLTITAPTANQNIIVTNNNNTIDVVATITDDVKVNTVVIKVGNTNLTVNTSGSTYTGTYTATTGGTFTATVTATDEEGLTTTKTVSFTIEDNINTDSEISEITTDPSVIRIDSEMNVSVIATDVEGIDKVEIFVIDANGGETKISTTTSGTTTSGTWSGTNTIGTYTVKVIVTDDKGNETIETKTVNVLDAKVDPVVTLNITLDGTSITENVLNGKTLNLTATITNIDDVSTVLYYIRDEKGTLVEVKSGEVAPFTDTWTVSVGTYTVTATVTDPETGLTISSEAQTFNVTLTEGLAEDNAIALNYSVFPNPAFDNATISFELIESANTVVAIYNAQGQVVSTIVNENLSADIHTLDIEVSELPAGIYFIQLVTGDTLAIQRLIVE